MKRTVSCTRGWAGRRGDVAVAWQTGVRGRRVSRLHYTPCRSFASSSSSSKNEGNSGPPQSPFKVFVDTLREQIKKNTEFQESVKQLQDGAGRLGDNEALRRAKEAYARARTNATGEDNEKLRRLAEEIRKAGGKVTDAIGEAWKGVEGNQYVQGSRQALGRAADGVTKATQPIRDTRAYKSISEAVGETLDTSGGRYAPYKDRELRRLEREAQRGGPPGSPTGGGALATDEAGIQGYKRRGPRRVGADPNAGESVVLHKDSAWKESWRNFKESNRVMQSVMGIKRSYDDSDNPLIAYTRSFTEAVGAKFASLFEENETAQVIRRIREMDPYFRMEDFLRELREFIVPEVIDSYLRADTEVLKQFCSEATYNVLAAGFEAQVAQGLISDSRIIELRNVDVASGKMLENDVPVFVVGFMTQEIVVFREAKTGNVVFGKENEVLQCSYAMIVTRVEDELANDYTMGWRIIDMAKQSSRPIL